MIRRARWVLLVSIAIGVGVWGYFLTQGRGNVQKYRTAVVERGSLTAVISATGTVNAVITVLVGSQVSGQLKELLADFNTRVRRDQVTARLDPELVAARVNEQSMTAMIRSAEAQRRVAEAMLQSARAQVKQKEAALQQARVDLEHATIRAPIDGVVVARSIDVGQTVAASLQAPTLFTIAQDLSRMQVETSVPEADIGRIKVGDAVTFTVDAFANASFTGRVTQIRQAAQNVQNVITYTVVVDVANPGGKLLPGRTANVKVIVAEKSNVLKVLNVALRFRPGEAGAGTGAQAGAALPRALVAGDARADGGQAASSAESTSDRLTRELGLSDEQRARIDSIR